MKHKDILKALTELPLFEKTSQTQIKELLHSDECRLLHANDGERIDTPDSPCLIVLLAGHAQIRSFSHRQAPSRAFPFARGQRALVS